MFEMENFEKELDEQNAALEAMLTELDESYSNSNNLLLDKVQATVDAKCTTVEACESMLAKLGNEISEFNNALSTMKSAVESYYTDGDKDALGDAIRPASEIIRSKYALIATEAVSSDGIVSDDEIKSVHDFLDGSKRIIRDKMNSLSSASESALDYLYDDDSDVVMEAAIDGLKRAIATLAKNMVVFCKKRAAKATSKKNQKRYQFWTNMQEWFSGVCGKMTGSMSEESLKKWHEKTKAKQQKCSEVAKAEDATDNSGEATAEESVLYNVIDMNYKAMEAAFEVYDDDTDFAMESALDAFNLGLVGGLYAVLVGMAVKAGFSSENKYLRRLQKEFKPQEKALNKDLKIAKKAKDYDKQIAIANKLIALNKSMIKDIEELGREVYKTYTKNSDGSTSESFKKAYNEKQNTALDKAKSNIENLTALIKMAQMDKKKSKSFESDVDAAFVEGYTRAIEAMSNVDSDVDDFLDRYAAVN